jgi:hypothetical protein
MTRVEAAKFLPVDEPRYLGQINEHAEHDDAPLQNFVRWPGLMGALFPSR